MSETVIQHRAELAEKCAIWARQPWLAVDTEFERVRTYFPRLCLVQVACPELTACICPIETGDLTPLVEVFLDRRICKVMHAARQDLEVLLPVCGSVPGPVFDTQVAAALVGGNEQVSYQNLVFDLIGTQLDKAHTRADWCKRPLTEDLVTYAIEDVRHLGALHEALSRELSDRGRMGWLEEECAALENQDLYRSDPEQAYMRLPRGHSLPIPQQHVLKALANWRERTAQELNLPRNWVASDANLMEITERVPHEVSDFDDVKGLRHEFRRRYGEEVMAMLKKVASNMPGGHVWDPRAKLTADQKVLREKLMGALRARAHELDIAVPVLGTRKDVDALVRGEKRNPLLSGWRFSVVGASLCQMITHHEAPQG